jgi:hypothetical protein
VLRLFVTKAELNEQILPQLKKFGDLKWSWLETAMRHHPDNPRLEVGVSRRVRELIDETGGEEQEARFMDALTAQLRTYEVGREQAMVYGWRVFFESGREELLAVCINMPAKRIEVCFYDEADWDEIKRLGVHLGEGQGTESINSQMRQLRQPN